MWIEPSCLHLALSKKISVKLETIDTIILYEYLVIFYYVYILYFPYILIQNINWRHKLWLASYGVFTTVSEQY